MERQSGIAAAQLGLSADWNITITPLDTCGLVILDGARYQRILQARDPVATTIVENYRLWSKANKTEAGTEATLRLSLIPWQFISRSPGVSAGWNGSAFA